MYTAGQSGAAKMMAKNVVQLRKQQEKMIKTKAQLSGVQNMTKVRRIVWLGFLQRGYWTLTL